MPNFNRRGFLQFLSAAGVAPLLPGLPTPAVGAVNGSVSKALWAGIYAKSGSAAKFVGVARNMGLSSAAIQGVGARSVGVRVALAAASNPMVHIGGAKDVAVPVHTERLKKAGKVLRGLERSMTPKREKTVVDQDAETLDDVVAPKNVAP
ncbi:MAG: twin-arginine translocation signal domain-containing protein [Tateyamaria sp.]|uniref:twin-arginine translocation signal domain-containing protein n=1 Tax=Tateyamaria sp. TaxID=1929288 RepID=UPI00329E74A7